MASEIQVTESLLVRASTGNGFYQSQPTGFTASLSNPYNGPTPGAVTVTHTGVDVSLAQLTALGGVVFLHNTDPTATVHVGVRDVATNTFYPLHEIPPTEFYRSRWSRHLLQDEPGTGSPGSGFGGTTVLHLKTDGGSAVVEINSFDA